MDCRQFHETFSDFMDDLLDEAGEILVRRHLGECERCRRFDAAYRAGVLALGNAQRLQVSPHFGARLRERVRREPLVPALVGSYGFAGGLLMLTLAALLVVDVRRHADTAGSREEPVAESAPARLPAPLEDRADLVTVRVANDWYDIGPLDPYVLGTSPYSSSAVAPVRFEVLAVWSGR